ncbi:MAG: response regulator [Gemmatimonadaceae bacterium]
MKVLIVEDDDGKRRALATYLSTVLPGAVTREASTFREALDAVGAVPPDLVLLDMTIPSLPPGTSDRDHTLVYGGRDVLRQLRRLAVRAYVVVVTQYESFDAGPESASLADLNEQLREVYPEFYCGAVSFSYLYDSWKEDLTRMIGDIEARLKSDIARGER